MTKNDATYVKSPALEFFYDGDHVVVSCNLQSVTYVKLSDSPQILAPSLTKSWFRKRYQHRVQRLYIGGTKPVCLCCVYLCIIVGRGLSYIYTATIAKQSVLINRH